MQEKSILVISTSTPILVISTSGGGLGTSNRTSWIQVDLGPQGGLAGRGLGSGRGLSVRAPGSNIETKGFLNRNVQTNIRDWSNGLGWKYEDRAYWKAAWGKMFLVTVTSILLQVHLHSVWRNIFPHAGILCVSSNFCTPAEFHRIFFSHVDMISFLPLNIFNTLRETWRPCWRPSWFLARWLPWFRDLFWYVFGLQFDSISSFWKPFYVFRESFRLHLGSILT